MSDTLIIGKITLIITTRCNLKCKLCCEYVPQSKPFPDMTLGECKAILTALFATVDHVTTLHLSGGGEPFLHSQLAELTEACMQYSDKFDRLMLFTNCTILPSEKLLETLKRHKDKLVVQVSRYGVNPARELEVLSALEATGVTLKIEKYYGDDQSFGGWVAVARRCYGS
jgi:MoaA/NifB/PqqE/SkfB family radical SAM enzyme